MTRPNAPDPMPAGDPDKARAKLEAMIEQAEAARAALTPEKIDELCRAVQGGADLGNARPARPPCSLALAGPRRGMTVPRFVAALVCALLLVVFNAPGFCASKLITVAKTRDDQRAMPKETAPAEESLLQASIRRLGAKRTRELLRGMTIGQFAPDAPPEWRERSAADFVGYLWPLVGRSSQLPPEGDWSLWAIVAGRGWGKSRTGSQFVVRVAERAGRLIAAGRLGREQAKILVLAPTSADLRDVVTEGDGGVLRCVPPWLGAQYEPSKRRITFGTGAEAILISADEPERVRGTQGVAALLDEAAVYPKLGDVFANVRMAVRLGDRPQICITTTPRNRRELRDILATPGTIITRGRTRDNVANLAPGIVAALERQYGGTRLGRQELEGELLTDNPSALWKLADIEATRVESAPADLRRVVVAVDPAVTSRPNSDETGILVCAVASCPCKGELEEHAFVLEDLSGVYSPDQWARIVVAAYRRHNADRVVAEVNQGGEMVENTLRTVDHNVAFKGVHASRGKAVRAEPIAALYEQRKVHHVGRALNQLEDQLLTWDPVHDPWSPDRLDGLVWGLTDLMVEDSSRSMFDVDWSGADGGGLTSLVASYTPAEQATANAIVAGMAGRHAPWGQRR